MKKNTRDDDRKQERIMQAIIELSYHTFFSLNVFCKSKRGYG